MGDLIERAAALAQLDHLRPARSGIPREVVRPPATPTRVAGIGRTAKANRRSSRVELELHALAARGIAPAPDSRLTNELRVIKRPLIRNVMAVGAAAIPKANLIMVTSALPGEGKSFTAINLAMSIAAEVDNTVMLVDADVVCPSVLQTLGLPPRPGLLNLLREESVEFSDVLLRTNIEKLSILPSGTSCAGATELLASDAMAALLDEMAGRYSDRILVFDSPPLLVTTESHVLASRMGQIVFVVDAETTLQRDVMFGLASIDACPVKLMVLNRAREAPLAGYGY